MHLLQTIRFRNFFHLCPTPSISNLWLFVNMMTKTFPRQIIFPARLSTLVRGHKFRDKAWWRIHVNSRENGPYSRSFFEPSVLVLVMMGNSYVARCSSTMPQSSLRACTSLLPNCYCYYSLPPCNQTSQRAWTTITTITNKNGAASPQAVNNVKRAGPDQRLPFAPPPRRRVIYKSEQ